MRRPRCKGGRAASYCAVSQFERVARASRPLWVKLRHDPNCERRIRAWAETGGGLSEISLPVEVLMLAYCVHAGWVQAFGFGGRE